MESRDPSQPPRRRLSAGCKPIRTDRAQRSGPDSRSDLCCFQSEQITVRLSADEQHPMISIVLMIVAQLRYTAEPLSILKTRRQHSVRTPTRPPQKTTQTRRGISPERSLHPTPSAAAALPARCPAPLQYRVLA